MSAPTIEMRARKEKKKTEASRRKATEDTHEGAGLLSAILEI